MSQIWALKICHVTVLLFFGHGFPVFSSPMTSPSDALLQWATSDLSPGALRGKSVGPPRCFVLIPTENGWERWF